MVRERWEVWGWDTQRYCKDFYLTYNLPSHFSNQYRFSSTLCLYFASKPEREYRARLEGQMGEICCRKEWRNEGALQQEGCTGPRVKVSEKRPDCHTETKSEQNPRSDRERSRGVECLAGNTFTSAIWPHILCHFTCHPLSQRQYRQAGCLSAALCTRSIVPHFLLSFFHPSPPFSTHTHALCTHTV